MSDLIEQLKQTRAKALVGFDRMAKALADGSEEVDRKAAAEMLRDSGKSPVDLEAAVARSKRIAELQKVVANKDDLARRKAELAAARVRAIDKQEAEKKAMMDKDHQAQGKFSEQDLRLRSALNIIADAEAELKSLTEPQEEPEERVPMPAYKSESESVHSQVYPSAGVRPAQI